MSSLTKYFKNSNTGEMVQQQSFPDSPIKGFPVYYYDKDGLGIGENLDLVGFVEISEKKFNREVKKLKKVPCLLSEKSKEELLVVREQYIGKYIGDFDKPYNYKNELKRLDKLIESKG